MSRLVEPLILVGIAAAVIVPLIVFNWAEVRTYEIPWGWVASALGWLAMAIMGSWAAGQRGRSSFGWFLLTVLFGPLALVALALAPSLTASDR